MTERQQGVDKEPFEPMLYEQWTGPVLDAAGLEPGDRVLDAPCGIGSLAGAALERVGADGEVWGVDPDEEAIETARRRHPGVEWRAAPLEALPFGDDEFDRVVSAFSLALAEDPVGGIREMLRVVRPTGRVAVVVWDGLEGSPGYGAMIDLLERVVGGEAARALGRRFRLGDTGRLERFFWEAGASSVELATREGSARFPSIRAWVRDLEAWLAGEGTLGDGFPESLLEEAEHELEPFVTSIGTVAFSAAAHFVTATKEEP